MLSGLLICRIFQIQNHETCCASVYKQSENIINAITITKPKKNKIFNNTYDIAPKRETSGGAHFRGLAPGLHSSEQTSQRWRTAGDTVLI